MPIEIRELHIRVAVNAQQTAQLGSPAGAAGTGRDQNAQEERKALVAECVEQVMRVLQNKRER